MSLIQTITIFQKTFLNHSEQQNMERGRRKDRFVSNRRKLQYESYKMPMRNKEKW